MCESDVRPDRRSAITLWSAGILAACLSFAVAYLLFTWIVTKILACAAAATIVSMLVVSIVEDLDLERLRRKAGEDGRE